MNILKGDGVVVVAREEGEDAPKIKALIGMKGRVFTIYGEERPFYGIEFPIAIEGGHDGSIFGKETGKPGCCFFLFETNLKKIEEEKKAPVKKNGEQKNGKPATKTESKSKQGGSK